MDRLVAWAREQVWALIETRMLVLQDILLARVQGIRLSEAEVLERIAPEAGIIPGPKVDALKPLVPYVSHPEGDWLFDESAASGDDDGARMGAVGVIPIRGVMTQRPVAKLSEPPSASTEVIGRVFDEMMADPAVKTILLDIESPGGSVFGLEELGAKIAAGSQEKRVVAIANSFAGSAAYWLFSQAREAVVVPGGQVGSIGVFTVHANIAAKLEAEGIQVTTISAGRLKTAGSEFGPLSDEARDRMQERVNDYYDRFVAAVSKGRGVPKPRVRSGFGEGMMVLDRAAVAEGMADRVNTFAQELLRARGTRRSRTTRAESWHQPLSEWIGEAAPVAADPPAPAMTDEEREALAVAEREAERERMELELAISEAEAGVA